MADGNRQNSDEFGKIRKSFADRQILEDRQSEKLRTDFAAPLLKKSIYEVF